MKSSWKFTLCLAFVAVLVTFTSQAEAKNDWYVNLNAGAVFLQDADNSGSVLSVENTFNAGPVITGAIGKKIRGFRLEGELSYRRNDIDEFTSVSSGSTSIALGSGLDGDGNVTTFGFMVNAAYDFKTGGKWAPFIMGGIGGARVNVNDAEVLGVALADDSTTEFAYQAGAGINYNFNENVALGLSYRFFGTTNPGLTDAAGDEFDSEYISHSVLVGLTYNF